MLVQGILQPTNHKKFELNEKQERQNESIASITATFKKMQNGESRVGGPGVPSRDPQSVRTRSPLNLRNSFFFRQIKFLNAITINY